MKTAFLADFIGEKKRRILRPPNIEKGPVFKVKVFVKNADFEMVTSKNAQKNQKKRSKRKSPN